MGVTIIGITGPTGAGKTTALREVQRLGGLVLDADAVYHQLLESNKALQDELEVRFGPLRDEAGAIDRKKLGTVVFRDPAAMADLNAITHPYLQLAIRGQLNQAEEEGRPLAAIDAIRLFESGTDSLCAVTVAVTAPAETRVRRIMAREGLPEDYARARVAAQQPDSYYSQRAHHTLVNDCASAEVFGQRARALFESILHTGKQ